MTEEQASELLRLFQKLIEKLEEHRVQIAIFEESFNKQLGKLREDVSNLKD
jgi:ribosome maturation protein Sdo1